MAWSKTSRRIFTEPEEFLDRFGREIASPDPAAPLPARILYGPRKVVSLDGECYLDPQKPGCGVWLALCSRGSDLDRNLAVQA